MPGVYDPMNGGSGDLSLNFTLWSDGFRKAGYATHAGWCTLIITMFFLSLRRNCPFDFHCSDHGLFEMCSSYSLARLNILSTCPAILACVSGQVASGHELLAVHAIATRVRLLLRLPGGRSVYVVDSSMHSTRQCV